MAVKFPGGAGSVNLELASAPGYDVYLLAGQSNMIGRAAIRVGIDDDYTAVSGSVFQYGYNSQTVDAAANPLDHVNENPGDMGLWLEFCDLAVASLEAGRQILLVPVSQGGTSFDNNNWNPGDSNYEGAKSRLASAMAEGAGTNALKAVLWLQGESDADAGAPAAAAYQGNLQAMYDAMVPTFSGMTIATPFIVGTIKPDKPNATAINSGLSGFATATTPAQYVDLTDLSWFDSDHYDAPSLVTAGSRFYGAL